MTHFRIDWSAYECQARRESGRKSACSEHNWIFAKPVRQIVHHQLLALSRFLVWKIKRKLDWRLWMWNLEQKNWHECKQTLFGLGIIKSRTTYWLTWKENVRESRSINYLPSKFKPSDLSVWLWLKKEISFSLKMLAQAVSKCLLVRRAIYLVIQPYGTMFCIITFIQWISAAFCYYWVLKGIFQL